MRENLASYTFDKRLITRIYRELKKLTSQKIKDSLNKWANELTEVQMANKRMKKCSTSLARKEMRIKPTLRFHLIPVKMAIINNTNNNMLVRMWRERNTSTLGKM
jgi:hypothetical protein